MIIRVFTLIIFFFWAVINIPRLFSRLWMKLWTKPIIAMINCNSGTIVMKSKNTNTIQTRDEFCNDGSLGLTPDEQRPQGKARDSWSSRSFRPQQLAPFPPRVESQYHLPPVGVVRPALVDCSVDDGFLVRTGWWLGWWHYSSSKYNRIPTKLLHFTIVSMHLLCFKSLREIKNIRLAKKL